MSEKKNPRDLPTKVIFILGLKQINFLDRFVFEVKQQSGYRMNKSEVVRALIDHLESKNIDPSKVASPEKLKSLLKK